MLVRFAGPRLAASDDDLVPVKLRRGGRILGGSLSWDKPQPLAAFSHEGPFGSMPVPNDVTVTRQVLAEPEAGLADRTWATLADGTPLVTAARRGKGLIVLFHVTADTRWSDLPLSGSFVEMLQRIVGLAGTTTSHDEAGQGQPRAKWCRRPASSTASAPSARRRDGAAGAGRIRRARHRRSSAGLLRPAGGPARRQHARARRPPGALDFAPLHARLEAYQIGEPQDLRGPVLLAALVLLALDALVVFLLAGGIGADLPQAPAAARPRRSCSPASSPR